jgi:hypothetical protein
MANPEFISRSFRVTDGMTLLLKPDIFPDPGVAVQVNKVPGTFEVRLILVDELLQICSFRGIVERFGKGYTVMTKS